MSDSLISQFQREYNAPIEVFRQVADITERDAISAFRRWEGMLVYVVSASATFELRGGLDNTSWALFTGLPDAPEDGSIYGRKDGAWQIITTESEIITDFEVTVTGIEIPPGNILFNEWRAIKKGSLVNISGRLVLSAATTFESPTSPFQLTGFPYGMIPLNSIYPAFMVNWTPDAADKICRGIINSSGEATFKNLSPTTTLNAIDLSREDFCTGLDSNTSRVQFNTTFEPFE